MKQLGKEWENVNVKHRVKCSSVSLLVLADCHVVCCLFGVQSFAQKLELKALVNNKCQECQKIPITIERDSQEAIGNPDQTGQWADESSQADRQTRAGQFHFWSVIYVMDFYQRFPKHAPQIVIMMPQQWLLQRRRPPRPQCGPRVWPLTSQFKFFRFLVWSDWLCAMGTIVIKKNIVKLLRIYYCLPSTLDIAMSNYCISDSEMNEEWVNSCRLSERTKTLFFFFFFFCKSWRRRSSGASAKKVLLKSTAARALLTWVDFFFF